MRMARKGAQPPSNVPDPSATLLPAWRRRPARQRLLLAAALIVTAIPLNDAAAAQLKPDLLIYESGLTAVVRDSSFKGGRLPDTTSVVGGGRAATFSNKPGSGLQFYFASASGSSITIDATGYAGLSFKLAAASSFSPSDSLVVGVQVQVRAAETVVRAVPLRGLLRNGAGTTAWQHVFVPLAGLAGNFLAATASFVLMNRGTVQGPSLYLQSISLVRLAPPACSGSGPTPSPRPPPAASSQSLFTRGNAIFWPNGTRFSGRGVNVFDTRSCGACRDRQSVAEAKRRIDFAVDNLGASFLRLALEAYAPTETEFTQYCDPDCNIDSKYLADIDALLAHVKARHPGMQVLLSAWQTKAAWGFSSRGWPTAATNALWSKLVEKLGKYPFVWFGVVNEPESNSNGAQDSQVLAAMNSAVSTIRAKEASLRQPDHIIAVQGTREWARSLAFYPAHPITAGGGSSIVYETHPYTSSSNFDRYFFTAARTLPVVIGEFGPVQAMTTADSEELMRRANAAGIPWLAWAFHQRCSYPEGTADMLEDDSSGGCGVNMPLRLSDWGRRVKQFL
ncbi:hypothetical protein D9Q98_006573 [Chlorella vulgaris]|uniref:Glycoside hydrolase family 5 domain-containing protein n=1 Tax=Chlorella vulgaris TaxID=3077 RepID=A0A9D4TKJ8_CHLVU|nr:hypothetical protein D9Q98_006573 [Chlorella vulgaris]